MELVLVCFLLRSEKASTIPPTYLPIHGANCIVEVRNFVSWRIRNGNRAISSMDLEASHRARMCSIPQISRKMVRGKLHIVNYHADYDLAPLKHSSTALLNHAASNAFRPFVLPDFSLDSSWEQLFSPFVLETCVLPYSVVYSKSNAIKF